MDQTIGLEYHITHTSVGSRVIRPLGEGWVAVSMNTWNVRPSWLPAKLVVVTTWARSISPAPFPRPAPLPFTGPLN